MALPHERDELLLAGSIRRQRHIAVEKLRPAPVVRRPAQLVVNEVPDHLRVPNILLNRLGAFGNVPVKCAGEEIGRMPLLPARFPVAIGQIQDRRPRQVRIDLLDRPCPDGVILPIF